MGKASSSKKVARAASTSGGRTARGRTPWVYYLSLVGIAVLGSAMVYTSRHHRLQKVNAVGATPPVAGKDHWRAAYRFMVCKGKSYEWVPPITNKSAPDGIGTNGDSVIDIQPSNNSAAGKNAVLGVFTKAVGVTLNAAELKVPSIGAAKETSGTTITSNPAYHSHDFRDGDSCGGKPGRVQVYYWGSSTTTVADVPTLANQPGTLWSGDPRLMRLYNNNLIVIAFMPLNATVPVPPADAIHNLETLNKPAPAPTTTTTSPTSTTSTTKPTQSSTTTTIKK